MLDAAALRERPARAKMAFVSDETTREPSRAAVSLPMVPLLSGTSRIFRLFSTSAISRPELWPSMRRSGVRVLNDRNLLRLGPMIWSRCAAL